MTVVALLFCVLLAFIAFRVESRARTVETLDKRFDLALAEYGRALASTDAEGRDPAFLKAVRLRKIRDAAKATPLWRPLPTGSADKTESEER